MRVDRRSRLQLRLQSSAFLLLFLAVIGLLAWLSHSQRVQWDWTVAGRHTLSPASQALLAQMPDRIRITSYASADEELRKPISALVEKYRRARSDIEFTFVNPDLEPERIRQLGISVDGETVVEYQGRSEQLRQLSEESFTNALQRLLRSGERWLVFLEGHGERHPLRQANHDVTAWAQQLQARGIRLQPYSLIENDQLPDNTTALIIASPQTDLLPGEVERIRDYVAAGGNLLWLLEPGALHGLEFLTVDLGIEPLAGTIVDPSTRLLGISDPRLALVTEYPGHAITQSLQAVTLFPQARGLRLSEAGDWDSTVLLSTMARSWAETGELSGEISFDAASDSAGPLVLGVALTRAVDGAADDGAARQQRVVVLGDGDFLSNAYLGNGSNLDLGLAIANWLAHDDEFVAIPARTNPDQTLELSTTAQAVIGFGFLLVLPLALTLTGVLIWQRRRKR